MLTYAIHQKNPADKNYYRGTNDIFFTNGSPIEEMQKIFEMRIYGNFVLPDGSRRFFVTTDKGLLIKTPFLTESVTLDWYEQSNKDLLVLGAPDSRIANWIAARKKQLAETEAYRLKVLEYYKNCIRIAGGTELSEEHLTLAKDVMNLDWYYENSDDISVYRAGRASFKRMEQRLEEAKVPGFMKAYTEIFIKR